MIDTVTTYAPGDAVAFRWGGWWVDGVVESAVNRANGTLWVSTHPQCIYSVLIDTMDVRRFDSRAEAAAFRVAKNEIPT